MTPPSGKQETTTPRAAGAQRAPATDTSAAKAPSVREAAIDGAREALKGAVLGKRPYLKEAFANPYNLSLLLGSLAASVLTLNPFIAVAALGLEGLWLLHGPDSSLLRRLLWDPKFEKLRLALEAQERAERTRNLQDSDQRRVEALVARQQEINTLAAENPSFTGDLLRNELLKTSRLVDAFIDMAVTCARYEEYLNSVDAAQIKKERQRWASEVESSAQDDVQADIAKRNLSILDKRIERMAEIRRYVKIARGQLDLIENSFQLIADQIVTMQSPHELSGQLDELLDGVEAIKQTAADTEKLLNSL